MEKTPSLTEFGDKHNICTHCQNFLINPDSVVLNFSKLTESAKEVPLAKEGLTIPDFVDNANCILCLGIWHLLHSKTFYDKMIQEALASEHEFEWIQLVIKFPISLRLR
jgi:hypothetical protein